MGSPGKSTSPIHEVSTVMTPSPPQSPPPSTLSWALGFLGTQIFRPNQIYVDGAPTLLVPQPPSLPDSPPHMLPLPLGMKNG